MTAPAIIEDLVSRFRNSRELYRSGRYNEAQLRLEFLNPLFEALGWDMTNRSNFAPQYREVIHEDSLEVEGSDKAPDYAFRIGTTRKFFVEAKKPAVDIRYAIHPAYQLRRYAWNAHLPLSILTDFEELAVYDCRTRPDPKDSAATGRVMLFTFEEYLTRWDELAQIFSKDAVWNGSFDRYAEGSKGKQGTTEVDAEFLKEIEEWRLLLARNIALRNFRSSTHAGEDPLNLPRMERQLNYAVQTTIDRILFLRICEDRGIEPADQLHQIAEGSEVYSHLLELFKKADLKYNSGLFHFSKEKGQTSEPDTFTPNLQIDDKVLRQIIKSAYYPCPYMFNEIPVEILGQVYEQFLGKVIRLTPGGVAKVEEKPEVRKAGGVYYTPRYIVDYIVQNTLGRLLNGNATSSEANGSGSVSISQSPGSQTPSSVSLRSPASPGGSPKNSPPIGGGSVSEASKIREAQRKGNGGEGQYIQQEQTETLRSEPVFGRETGTNKAKTSFTPSSEGDQGGGSKSRYPDPEDSNLHSSFSETHTPASRTLSQERVDPLTPTEALKLRVVDPACGSGSFLLGAFQYLLDWHLNYYLTHDPQSHTRGKNPPLVAAEGGEYRLTTDVKKRILTSSIHGVDIDAQAVEVTKLSLLLKLLEGETGQLSLGFERVLPDLGNNIRCGNSLIDWDYFHGQMFPDEEEIQRVNPFDWQRAFPAIFAEGGFDAVIGNPPYIRQESLGDDKRYYQTIYEVFTGTADIYSYFIEKGVNLLAPGGQFSYIVANKWLRAKYGSKLRQWLKARCIEEITDFGDLPVFTGATTYPLILRVSNNPPHHRPRVTTVDTLDFASLQEYVGSHGEIADQTRFEEYGWSLAGKTTQDLLAKMRQNSIPLGEYVHGKVYRGILTGLNKAFVIDQATKDRLIAEDPRSAELIKPFAQGRDIKRYAPIPVKQYLILIPKGWTNQHRKGNAWNWFSSQYPAIASHLKQFEKEAIARGDKGDYWWELRACEYYDEFEKPKIVYPNILKQPEFTLDQTGIYTNQKCFIIPTDDLYLLGILNSSVSMFLFTQMFPKLRGEFYEPSWAFFQNFPIHVINPIDVDAIRKKEKMISLVQKMLELCKNNPITPQEQVQIQGLMHITSISIDGLVRELYSISAVII